MRILPECDTIATAGADQSPETGPQCGVRITLKAQVQDNEKLQYLDEKCGFCPHVVSSGLCRPRRRLLPGDVLLAGL